jgi:uncharacterized protein YciI
MSYFLYRFTPRPDFVATMSDAEAAVMHEHVAYWQTLADKGTAIVVGPVADPAGAWGMAVAEADSLADAEAIHAADPIAAADLGPVAICPMPSVILRS